MTGLVWCCLVLAISGNAGSVFADNSAFTNLQILLQANESLREMYISLCSVDLLHGCTYYSQSGDCTHTVDCRTPPGMAFIYRHAMWCYALSRVFPLDEGVNERTPRYDLELVYDDVNNVRHIILDQRNMLLQPIQLQNELARIVTNPNARQFTIKTTRMDCQPVPNSFSNSFQG